MQESYPTIPGTEVEIIVSPTRGRVRHALFDWDGTVSYMRDGWQDFMVPLMIEVLEACPRHESREELQDIVVDPTDKITYIEIVPEVTSEPDYDKALEALKNAAG